MKLYSNLRRRWHNLQNIDECFFFQKKLMIFTGYWPQNPLKNRRSASAFLLIGLILIAKVNYLKKVVIAADYKNIAIVLPELFITLGYFWVSLVMLRTEKVLKKFLDGFVTEWNLSKKLINFNVDIFLNDCLQLLEDVHNG